MRWLLGTPDAATIARTLAGAEDILTSSLTSAEVGRTLHRLRGSGALTVDAERSARERYSTAASHWSFHAVTDEVLVRAADAFTVEPVRTLDAVHLATAEIYSRRVDPLAVLSVDEQFRRNARAIGLVVLPKAGTRR